MGSLKKFASWLSGDGRKKDKDPVRAAITSLKIFNKRLARQARKMEMQSKNARKKAIERRRAGDVTGSKMHMKSSLQFQKWVHASENFRVRLEGVQFKLEQARAMNQFVGVAEEIAGILGTMQMTIKAPEISKLLAQLDLGFGNMDALLSETTEELEVMEDSSSTGVSEDEVELALAEVDAELSIDTRAALPSIPSVPGMDEKEGLDSLEAEIARLKSQRDP